MTQCQSRATYAVAPSVASEATTATGEQVGRRKAHGSGRGKTRKTQERLLGVLVDHLLQLVLRPAGLDRDVVARVEDLPELVPLRRREHAVV